jgi:hypothetical protein
MEATQKVKKVTKATKKTKSVSEEVPVVVSQDAPASVVPESESEPVTESSSTSSSAVLKEKEIRLTEIPVVDEITALNLMVSFLGLAQKRGAYTIDEASKIWECIKKFQRPG